MPRILIPIVTWISYKGIKQIADDHTLSARLICSGLAVVHGVIYHTFFVLVALVLLYPDKIGATDNISARTIILTNLVAINILIEMLTAVWITCLVVGLSEQFHFLTDSQDAGDPESKPRRPLRITFQKWLLLIMVMTFLVMLVYFYRLLTSMELTSAERLLRGKSYTIMRLLAQETEDVTGDDLRIGKNGYSLLAREGTILISSRPGLQDTELTELGIQENEIETGEIFSVILNGVPGACYIDYHSDILILVYLPDMEIYAGRNNFTIRLLGFLLLSFWLIFVIINGLVRRNVVFKIEAVNNSLAAIRKGNLDEKVTISGNTEFEELSLGINTTVDALKSTMEQIEKKNHEEMEFARGVQHSALPSPDSVRPVNGEYEILGLMDTAKEVGGDFFDYFLVGKDKLGFVIADVSGKGVPAALFMMTSKTLIKNLVLSGLSPAEALEKANTQLCENNEKEMFVTVWLGLLDYKKGELVFANAAHNPPLLKKAGQPMVYMDHKSYRRSLMLGGMQGIRYHNNVLSFTKGDMLFLYTDGVTEAVNTKMELYGEDRLMKCLNSCYDLSPDQLMRQIRKDIDIFASDMEQFDDITMVTLKMK